MNARTLLSDKQALIDEGKRIVPISDDAKFLRKVTIVNLMLNGASASSLSPSCGETARTLISWMKTVDEKGFNALRPESSREGQPGSWQSKKKKLKSPYFARPKIPVTQYGMARHCPTTSIRLAESALA